MTTTLRTLIGTLEITADTPKVPTVRNWAREQLAEEPRDVVDEIALPLTEVVTNAILHSQSGVKDSNGIPGSIYIALLRVDRAIRAEVTDEGPLPSSGRPRVKANGKRYATTGRGLKIVHAYSAGRWGVERHTQAQTVWFEVATR